MAPARLPMRTRDAFLALASLLAGAFGGAASAEARCGRSGVTVYSAYWCPYCKATERFLDSRGIRYERIEVADNGVARRFMAERFGTTAVPVVVVNGGYWTGHNEQRLRQALCLR